MLPQKDKKPVVPRPFPKKYLGQHFLVDEYVKNRILLACDIQKTDTVLEIGPGLGALTKGIVERAGKVYAVETDAGLCKTLSEQFASHAVTIIHDDFLKYNFAALPQGTQGIKVIGNLPYNISTLIIEKLIANRQRLKDIFFTVQLEFGKRLAAVPHSKDYGSLSCFVQYYGDVRILFKIKNTAFRPVPKVTSCFVRISFKKPQQIADNEDLLFKIIRHAFQQRRKKLSNAFLPLVPKDTLDRILKETGISSHLRPENLSVSDYVAIANKINEL